jgi:hypothetical protein
VKTHFIYASKKEEKKGKRKEREKKKKKKEDSLNNINSFGSPDTVFTMYPTKLSRKWVIALIFSLPLGPPSPAFMFLFFPFKDRVFAQ